MSGKNPRLSAFALRKQLLLAESELNRANLSRDLAALAAGARTLADRAKRFDAMASSGAVLLTGLAAFQRTRSAGVDTKHSWWRSLIKGAGLISTFWLALRPQRRDGDEI